MDSHHLLIATKQYITLPNILQSNHLTCNTAFMINNTDYSVLYPNDLEGSVLPNGTFSNERLGKPGVWIKEVLADETTVSKRLCPPHGKLGELLKVPEEITQSIRHMKLAASENPDDGPLRMGDPHGQPPLKIVKACSHWFQKAFNIPLESP